MDIVKKLTLKHLSLNKKRTIVTILGIIISVAMFSAVTTFASSFMAMMQNETMKYSGDWHVSYQDVDNNNISILQKDKNTKKIVSLYHLDTTLLNNQPLSDYRPFIDIKTLDAQSFKDTLPLKEGKYPTKEQEIVIPNSVLQNTKQDIKVGDTITLYGGYQDIAIRLNEGEEIDLSKPIDKGSYKYVVTGISDDSFIDSSRGNSYACYTLTTENTISHSISNQHFVTLNIVSNALYNDSKELASKLQISDDNVDFNRTLLMYYGVTTNDGFLKAMYTVIFIIMSIIMIGSIALIYNAFAISLSERSKYLGMLASVGATKNQKRKSVYFEGILLGIISIPLGIISGIGGLGVTFACINPIMKNISDTDGFPLVVSIPGIVLAVIFAIVTIALSSYIPARRASKISPIEALRASKDIKISNKAVKTSRITKILFGFEGELAMKNLKRNKKRYRITVISLIVSVVLFLSVSGFTYYMKNSFTMSNASLNYDVRIYPGDEGDNAIKEIQTAKNIDEIAIVNSLSLSGSIDTKKINQDLLDFLKAQNVGIPNDEEFYLSIDTYSFDDMYFKEYCKKHNINFNDNSAIIISKNVIGENRKFKETPLLDYQKYVNDINLSGNANNDTFHFDFNTIITDENLPLGIDQPRNYFTLTMFISEAKLQELSEKCGYSGNQQVFIKATDAEKLDKELSPLMENYANSYYYNVAKEANMMDQMLFVIQVFTYGFIVLISLISIANIFNTITTSMALRTKEFAMLKSVGMTPKAFNKMIYFESLFYGIQALIIGIPLGIGIMFWMHNSMNDVFNSSFTVPISSFVIVIIAVFIIIGSTLLYSAGKIKKQNIIDGLKDENV